MKKRKIQVVVVLFIAAVTLLSSSFGRQVDIEERVLCHAMGVDYENGEYNVSLQVFKTQSMGSDTPLDVSQSNIQTVNCKGRSIRDAIEGCQYQLGREIFFGHLQIICFNKNIDLSSPEELFSFAIKDKNVFLWSGALLGGKYRRGAYERSANKGNDVLRKLHTGHKNGCEKRRNGGVPPYRSAFLHKITAVYRYAGYLYQTTAGRFCGEP